LPALAARQTMQRLGHPQRTFAARRALATTLVRIKFGDVAKRFDDVGGIIQYDDRARTRHATSSNERIEIVRQIEHTQFLLHILPVRAAPFQLKLLVRSKHFRRRTAGNNGLELASVEQSAAEFRIVDELSQGRLADLDLVVTRPLHMAADAHNTRAGI